MQTLNSIIITGLHGAEMRCPGKQIDTSKDIPRESVPSWPFQTWRSQPSEAAHCGPAISGCWCLDQAFGAVSCGDELPSPSPGPVGQLLNHSFLSVCLVVLGQICILWSEKDGVVERSR